MELPVIDDKASHEGETGRVRRTSSAAQYSEALVHQLVTAYLANARLGTRAQRARNDRQQVEEEALEAERHWSGSRGQDVQPAVAGRRQDPSQQPGRELQPRRTTQGLPVLGSSAILSQLTREGRLSVVDTLRARSQPKTKLLARSSRGWGWPASWSSPTTSTRTCTCLPQPARRAG